MISLDPITEDNRKFYQTFEDLYVSNLQQYQSRIYPNAVSYTHLNTVSDTSVTLNFLL